MGRKKGGGAGRAEDEECEWGFSDSFFVFFLVFMVGVIISYFGSNGFSFQWLD